ncbi:PilN domain-containing protein [Synergistes jonesii]|uniref:Fimbrial assembly protein n=1 Tax=Synergistes jonesii TaxID=2754 RepID=A0A073J2B9_9BACT|nr:PilN domain-containing protein [Synergistes jonesii]KEJ91847.1 hypothetical protein EH55_07715 [Synergistes jonesii]OFB61007.1 hypothetical protein JS73_09825 [Synergistes jonesii]OFB61135.1 hypothetical protein JS72_11450 [Synergistes jonesii]OFB62065.1 hypothetical protein JS79_09970 [Synergistes jonesii]OFB67075.1 hypothetical protein JS78_09835 [Synergistes jonesii]
MVVKIDLRANKQAEASEKENNVLYYAVFAMAALFILSSILVIAKSAWRIYSLRDEEMSLERRTAANNEKLAVMDAEFKRIEAQNRDSADKLDFVLSGLPVVEFLYEIGERTPDGVALESVSMSNAVASLKGVAFADEEVLELGKALAAAKGVESVSLPAISAGQREGLSIRQFALEVKLNPLWGVLAEEESAEKRDSGGSGELKDGGARGSNEAD